MAKYVFLDSGPLTLACKQTGHAKAESCRAWIRNLQAKGYVVLVPEIIDYEARRAFILSSNLDWLSRLDAFATTALVPLTRDAILKAAEFWALLRSSGVSTAPPEALDIDVLLAAQAVTLTDPEEDTIIIATTNVGHLNRFPGVEAKELEYIT